MSIEEIKNNANNTKDILRNIIKKHSLDIIFGNDREELNYVDGLYPFVEMIFGTEICKESIVDEHILKNYYEENYNTIISYDGLLEIFSGAKKICDELDDKNKILKFSKDFEIIINNVCKQKVTAKTSVK